MARKRVSVESVARSRSTGDDAQIRDEVRRVWNANAEFWDQKMGEGNLTHLNLVAPGTIRLLALRQGENILEIACGNGQLARQMARLGGHVLATDQSEEMLSRARAHPTPAAIEYRRLDATDPKALRRLGAHRFSAIVCSMALMDMSDIRPLAAGLRGLLTPGGRFVFSVTHPCFNNSGARRVFEEEDVGGTIVERAGVFVHRYATPATERGLAMIGQPLPQPYFDRPLGELLRPFFEASMALDALEEPVFPKAVPPNRPTSWIAVRDIPPILIGRLRPMMGSRATRSIVPPQR
jgi:2-polyprenyl-3-methyl-5-hydroxy-6-metoxy-1,4-benzoquinol methylase